MPTGGSPITSISPTGGTNLDQFIASMANLTGNQGQQQFQSGTEALAPVLSQLTGLAKGDQGDVTQATQPQIDQISQQFDQIRNMISMQPRGGGKTTALAEAPFQKAGDIQRTQQQAVTGAQGQLANLGLGIANLGVGQENTSANIGLQKQSLDYGQPSVLGQINQTAATWL
jgi:hypothetical protein